MVIGWYFGPIVGLVFGAITDTISFLLPGGGIWFWMYAIQEPIIGLLSGLVGSVCRIRKSSQTNKITIDIIINQVMVIGFAIISSFALIYWLDPSHPYRDLDPEYEKFYQVYK
ncbi:MAG: ECF transporter S component [Mycoplasmoidaceae bacterium]|nr:ECF transporter S component [Mycoplasmoidaceae bacterium]